MDHPDLSGGPLPLYHRLYLVLRQQIEDGRFPSDIPLPSEFQLSRQHGVSRITVRRTMDILSADGLVERSRGRGTFARVGRAKPGVNHLTGLADNLSSYAAYTTVTLHSFEYVAAPPGIAEALVLRCGASVQKAVRTRSRDGVPVSLLVTHVPDDLGRSFTPEDLQGCSLIRLLERAGARAESANSWLTAKLADPVSAPLLDVQVGQPLIAVTRITADAGNRPVEHLDALYRPDQYKVHLTMSREAGGSPNSWRYEHETLGGRSDAPSPA